MEDKSVKNLSKFDSEEEKEAVINRLEALISKIEAVEEKNKSRKKII